jgi:hypothetical protein
MKGTRIRNLGCNNSFFEHGQSLKRFQGILEESLIVPIYKFFNDLGIGTSYLIARYTLF